MPIVVESSNCITLTELQHRLEENEGILLWISREPPVYRVIKGPLPGVTDKYSWFSTYFHRGNDRRETSISSVKDLTEFISRLMNSGDRFYWFASEADLIVWLRETQ